MPPWSVCVVATGDLAQDVIYALDPVRYAYDLGAKTGYAPTAWQQLALVQHRTTLLLANRQDGKSTTMALKCVHRARFKAKSLSLVFSASERQAAELLLKARLFVGADPFIDLARDNGSELRLTNGSRIVALPATDNTTRGYTDPDLLIYDEASQIPDSLYYMSSAMLNDRPDNEEVLGSTPFGKRGVFWEAWKEGEADCKILVRVAYDFKSGHVVAAEPEAEWAKRWKRQGVHAWYSTRKSKRWLEREMRVKMIPEAWMRQEHACEFLDVTNSIIPYEYFEDALAAGADIKPLFRAAGDDLVSSEVRILRGGRP